jgi:5'-3' exonuclease
MGVSSYFAWIVKHFKSDLIKSLNSEELSEISFKNLYFDFNSLIHPAVKKHDGDTPQIMIKAVLKYMKHVIDLVNPTEMVYIAIDGVPPMAKIHQQRLRRFKNVFEKQELTRIYDKNHIPEEERTKIYKTDYNMISPGTSFMSALSKTLKMYFDKMKSDKKYEHLRFVLSDDRERCEGEHKIINHIRENTYDEMNCIYGLDSDLLFLTLTLSKPEKIHLIREDVFGLEVDSRPKDEREMPIFNYFLIGRLFNVLVRLLGSYTDITGLEACKIVPNDLWIEKMREIKKEAPINTCCMDDKRMRNLIIDYMFICYMLGNDFLPVLPSLKIYAGGLDDTLFAYKLTLLKLNKFLIEYEIDEEQNFMNLTVNHTFLTTMLEMLYDTMKNRFSHQEEAKQKQISRTHYELKTKCSCQLERDMFLYEHVAINRKYGQSKSGNMVFGDEINSTWKMEYYIKKFGYDHSIGLDEYGKMISNEYFKGMIWTLNYYLSGQCIDWDWYYMYDGAPALDDLYNYVLGLNVDKISIDTIDFGFNYDSLPMEAIEQLLCILPPQSRGLLPKKMVELIDLNSEIAQYFPEKVDIDILDKRFMWECHPKIPLVNVKLYKEFYKILKSKLIGGK